MLKAVSVRLLQKCQNLRHFQPTASPLSSSNRQSPLTEALVRRFLVHRSFSTKSKFDEFSILTEETNVTLIDGYFSTGFKWRAQTMEDVTPESLCFLRLFRPLPDLLVLGCGPVMRPVPPDVAAMLQELHIRVECIDSINATSTFNLLNQEGRSVVGAMLPLSVRQDSDDEM